MVTANTPAETDAGSPRAIVGAEQPRFPLGTLAFTHGAREALVAAGQNPYQFLERHQRGDWGEMSEEDRRENELSVAQGFRILSAYTTSQGERLWIITEADRRYTTILLPAEY